MKLLIGTDPEVFLRSKTSGKFVSAHGKFPGTKDDPFPLFRGAMQVDGHALEFNTEPVDNEDDFVEVVSSVYAQVSNFVNDVNPDLEIALEPVAVFDKEYFDSLPEISKELGCSPDFSSITGKVLTSPAISHEPIRTGSGHIHIGWTMFDDSFQEKEFAERLKLANKITPYLLEVAKEWETEASEQRRNYYGKEGAFRPKHYGVELRALDNLWLRSTNSMRKVFRTAVSAFEKEYTNAS